MHNCRHVIHQGEKTRQELLNEIIAQSKERKLEKARGKEEQESERERLDESMGELLDLLHQRPSKSTLTRHKGQSDDYDVIMRVRYCIVETGEWSQLGRNCSIPALLCLQVSSWGCCFRCDWCPSLLMPTAVISRIVQSCFGGYRPGAMTHCNSAPFHVASCFTQESRLILYHLLYLWSSPSSADFAITGARVRDTGAGNRSSPDTGRVCQVREFSLRTTAPNNILALWPPSLQFHMKRPPVGKYPV